MPVNRAASALAGLFSLALTLFCVYPAPLLVSAAPSWLVVSKFHTHCFLFVPVISRLPSVAFSETTSLGVWGILLRPAEDGGLASPLTLHW